MRLQCSEGSRCRRAFETTVLALAEEEEGGAAAALLGEGKEQVRIVLMTGFESFNVASYKQVCPGCCVGRCSPGVRPAP